MTCRTSTPFEVKKVRCTGCNNRTTEWKEDHRVADSVTRWIEVASLRASGPDANGSSIISNARPYGRNEASLRVIETEVDLETCFIAQSLRWGFSCIMRTSMAGGTASFGQSEKMRVGRFSLKSDCTRESRKTWKLHIIRYTVGAGISDRHFEPEYLDSWARMCSNSHAEKEFQNASFTSSGNAPKYLK